MSDDLGKPLILLAFANDHRPSGEYLPRLAAEAHQIKAALEPAEKAGLCQVELRQNCTPTIIFKMLREYRSRLAIFHYGGHAGEFNLQLETPSGDVATLAGNGFADFLKERGLCR